LQLGAQENLPHRLLSSRNLPIPFYGIARLDSGLLHLFLQEIARGARFRILALGFRSPRGREKLPYSEICHEVGQTNPKELASLQRILERTKDHGPPFSAGQARRLNDSELCEFRTRGGLRIFWVFDRGHSIVCLCGYRKAGQRLPLHERERAERMLANYRTHQQRFARAA